MLLLELVQFCQLPNYNLFTQHLVLFAWRVTTSETLNPGPSFIFIAFVVTIALSAATTLLLLCLVGDWGSLNRLHPSTQDYFLVPLLLNILSSAFSGVVELTTQLLRLVSILWLPLCRINKLGHTTLEDYRDPLHLWVSKIFSGAVAGEHSFTYKFT